MRRTVLGLIFLAAMAGAVGEAAALPVHRGPCSANENGVITGAAGHEVSVCIGPLPNA